MKTSRNLSGFVLSLALVLLFGVAGLAEAQMGTGMDRGMGSGMRSGMQGTTGMGTGAMRADDIGGLTQEQQATVRKIYAEHHANMAKLRRQLFAKRSELNAQLYGENTDEARVDALTREIGDIYGKIYRERVDLHRALVKEGIPEDMGYGMGLGMGPAMIGHGMGHGMMGRGMMGVDSDTDY